MTSFSLLTPPAVEPVVLADAKAQARIDTTADDALVSTLIVAARQWAERYTGRAFITQSWQVGLDAGGLGTQAWWDGVREGPVTCMGAGAFVVLPRPPLISVVSITAFDDSDVGTVWPSGNYYVDNVREPGRVVLRTGAVWPLSTRRANGIVIQYTAGYGADGSAVPEAIKLAIKQLVAHWYENRGEAAIAGSGHRGVRMVPVVIEALLEPYRVQRLGV